MALTNLWANPSYTAAAPYHAAFLVSGFLLGRRAGPEGAAVLLKAAILFALALAGWALWQRVGENAARSQALFQSPATLGATLNLILLPVLVVLAWGPRRPILAIAALLLVAGMAAAGSRGAWLAGAAGGTLALYLARRAGVWRGRSALSAVATIVGLGIVLGGLLSVYLDIGSSVARLNLYAIALTGLATTSLALGSGYLAFYYLLESARGSVAGFAEVGTYFVHNDYLQTLLELGIPGLILLLGLVALPLSRALRAASEASPDRRLIAIAAAAALGSMATHALVDFPFYVPVCLLIYGAAVGLLDSLQAVETSVRVPGVVVVAGATLGLWILVTPLAAYLAAGHAGHEWRLARGESAAYWFEVARRIEPRDWRYHWYAGQFWYAQAAANQRPEAARLADAAFAAGYAANPREARNLVGRISAHLRLRSLLAEPVDAATLREWADRALALAPLDRMVQAERKLVLQGLPK